jgi:PAS domain S-box-containing protein
MNYYQPSEIPILKEKINNCLEDGIPFSIETTLSTETGKQLFVEVRGISPIENNERSYVIGTLQDITERKRIEKLNQTMAHMLDVAPNSITVHDTYGKFLYANKKTFELHGYTESEFMSINLHELDVPESEAMLNKRFDLINENGEASFEVEHYHKNGSIIPLEVIARAVSWQNQSAILSIATDISERHRHVSLIRMGEERIQALLDANPDIMLIISQDGFFIDCHASHEDDYFLSPSLFLNQHVSDVLPDYLSELTINKMNLLFESGEMQTYKYSANMNSEPRSFECRLVLCSDNYAMAIIRDITDIDKIEKIINDNTDRFGSLLKLNEMSDLPLQEITDFVMETVIRLTKSKLGYIAFVDDTETILTMYSWSHSAMNECKISNKPISFSLEDTGLWGEAVRQRIPIITNDYNAPNPLKKGYPEGHVNLHRHMNIPIFSHGKIVMIAGVGNKDWDYNHYDVQQLKLFMDDLWKFFERKRIYQTIKENEELHCKMTENISDVIAIVDSKGVYKYISPNSKYIFGWDPLEKINLSMSDFIYNEDQDNIELFISELLSDYNTPNKTEFRYKCKNNNYRWVELSAVNLINDKSIAGILMNYHDIHDQKIAQEKVNLLVREKELHLKEVHHRIKNNMNIIISILSIQSSFLSNSEAISAIRDAENRVRSMMLLYDKLFRSENPDSLSIKDYLPALINEIIHVFPQSILVKVVTKLEDCILDVNTLSPLGIIINEIITNTMKHAFNENERGIITVESSFINNHVTLSIHDNGIGIPDSIDIGSSNSSSGFGMKLIGILVKQIRGSIKIERLNGTKFIIEFDI